MSDEKSDPREMSRDDLEERIKRGRDAAGLTAKPEQRSHMSEAGPALRAAIEFVVSTCVGAGLGFGIGAMAGNKSIGIVLGLLIGFAAGIRGMMRIMAAQDTNQQGQDGDGR